MYVFLRKYAKSMQKVCSRTSLNKSSTAEDNGTWFHGTTSTGGTAGNRNGRVIDFGVSDTFDETSAFVNGLVPYGDIP